MAMARCVLGSDVGGIRELITDGRTGLLFQAGSAGSLQEQLRRLFSGDVDGRAIGARAREHVVAHRQWRHMATVYDAAYAHAQAVSARRSR
jgi:glycosyltransferase involved in cell wall biosynthesis